MGECVDLKKQQQALEMLNSGQLPGIAVIDLDYTCWKCYVDSLAGPPFRFTEKSRMVCDRRNWEIELYPEAKAVIMALHEAGVKVALGSRTEEPEWAEIVIKTFKIDGTRVLADFACGWEISSGSMLKTTPPFTVRSFFPKRQHQERHFQTLREKTGIEYEQMIFFDDERRNIVEVGRLGVTCIHCEEGLSIEALAVGLKHWREKMQQQGNPSGNGGTGSASTSHHHHHHQQQQQQR